MTAGDHLDPAICRAIRVRTNLTPRQSTVAGLLYMRRTNAEIASECGISIHTAKRHVEMVLLKLRAKSRFDVEAAVHAVLQREEEA